MSAIARALRNTPVRYAYHWLKSRLPGRAQSDEAEIVKWLADGTSTFIEFGFHPTQFNCIGLKGTHRGLLIDCDASTVKLARWLLPPNIEIRESFLSLDNIGVVSSHFVKLGVLSIDVDGNDYWFLERLLPTLPAVIAVEYNASFGYECVSVPYDSVFNRHEKHPSGWYHGASLSALTKLCARIGYGLAAVAEAGATAFFTPDGQLDPRVAYRPNWLRDQWSKTTISEQWQAIKHLPRVYV